MHPCTAHALLVHAQQRGEVSAWPGPESLRDALTGPLELTALAVLSGGLPAAEDLADVLAAAAAGFAMLESGAAEVDDFSRAAADVLGQLDAVCGPAEAAGRN